MLPSLRAEVGGAAGRRKHLEQEILELRGPRVRILRWLHGDDDVGDAREQLGVKHDAKDDRSALEDVEDVRVLTRMEIEEMTVLDGGRFHGLSFRTHRAV